MDQEKFTCPVCGYKGLDEAPYNENGEGSFEICFCCGYEFGFDDESEEISHEDYRKNWIEQGAQWFDEEEKPEGWDLEAQLKNTIKKS